MSSAHNRYLQLSFIKEILVDCINWLKLLINKIFSETKALFLKDTDIYS